MITKYCELTEKQLEQTKKKMRTKLFFLLLIKDPNPEYAEKYKDIDVGAAFEDVLLTFGGLNDLLGNPQVLVSILAKVSSARSLLVADVFNYCAYRKLILDAGNEVLQIGGE